MSIFAGHNAQVALAMVVDHPFISDFGTCCECFKSTLLTDLIDVFRVISDGVDRDQTHEEKNWPMEQSPANLNGLHIQLQLVALKSRLVMKRLRQRTSSRS